jgi:uncharacterized membrane protein (DUF106 family)
MVFESLTGFFIGPVGMLFSPLASFNPTLSLFFIAVFIATLINVLNLKLVDHEAIAHLKQRMEDAREAMTAAQKSGDNESSQKSIDNLLKINQEFMKHNYKRMMISLVIVIIFLPYVSSTYEGTKVAALPMSVPMFGDDIGWIVWYFIVSFTIGWVVQKMFGIGL